MPGLWCLQGQPQGWAQAAVTSKLHADLGRVCLIMGLPKGPQTKAWGESPSTFLKRVFEAYQKYTSIYFLKLQKLEGWLGMPISQLVEISLKVFNSYDQVRKRQQASLLTKAANSNQPRPSKALAVENKWPWVWPWAPTTCLKGCPPFQCEYGKQEAFGDKNVVAAPKYRRRIFP